MMLSLCFTSWAPGSRQKTEFQLLESNGLLFVGFFFFFFCTEFILFSHSEIHIFNLHILDN